MPKQGAGMLGGAASGAGMGFMMGGPPGAIIGGAAGLGMGLLSGLGADASAEAAQQAASAQLAQEQANRERALKLADPSPMEIQQLEQAVTTNQQEIDRKTRLLESADPALIEAGRQALALMQGQEAKSLAPVKRQRDEQRRQLESTLRAQLGPDYANTTAGSQALNSFDTQTNDVLAIQQDRTLAQLLGTAERTSGGNQLTPNIAANMQISQQRGNINTRQMNALLNTPVNPGLAYQGDITRAAQHQQFLNSAIGGIATIGSAYLMGNSKKPTGDKVWAGGGEGGRTFV